MSAAAPALSPPSLHDYLPSPGTLAVAEREALLEAGREVLNCRRVLIRGGLNVVGEVLRGQADFVEFEHYPNDDVFDGDSHAQYYYHAHRGGELEHGHFHTFLRAEGMPAGIVPVRTAEPHPPGQQGEAAISHLVAVSMDAWGEPIGLFATNRWVTDEDWFSASDVIKFLPRFEVDHAFPSWPVNRWLGALLRLYRPWIEGLLRHRDAVIAAWQAAYPDGDVFEDRRLEMTGYLPISVADLMNELSGGVGIDRVSGERT